MDRIRRMADDGWRPTVAHYRAAATAWVLVTAALLFGRIDVLLLAAPLAIVAAWSTIDRPTTAPAVSDTLSPSTIREGGTTTWLASIEHAHQVDLVTARIVEPTWLDVVADGATAVPVVAGAARVSAGFRSTRWGHRLVEPARISASSVWGSFRFDPRPTVHPLTTLPIASAVESHASITAVDGLIGAHRSVRPGEGSEFASIRRFQTGDRLRRINWTRSLRSDALHVNATWADQDIHVALVVDSADDLGVSGGVDGPASSLDITVRAAAAIADHYLGRGDRLSLRCTDPSSRLNLPPASGAAQLRRVLDALTRLTPSGQSVSFPHRLIAGAEMTIVLSPLASPEILSQAVLLNRAGGRVVVVDTLPDDVVDHADATTSLAWRIRLLERRRELRAASELGIVAVRWRGPTTVDQLVRDIARHAATPRVRP